MQSQLKTCKRGPGGAAIKVKESISGRGGELAEIIVSKSFKYAAL